MRVSPTQPKSDEEDEKIQREKELCFVKYKCGLQKTLTVSPGFKSWTLSLSIENIWRINLKNDSKFFILNDQNTIDCILVL